MMKFYKLVKADDGKHKFIMLFKDENNKELKVKFGAVGYEDYTIHKDDKRKELYINRHKKNEDWNNPYKAGTLSRYILWNKKTIKDSLEDYRKKFNV
jgi:hypothetical protein